MTVILKCGLAAVYWLGQQFQGPGCLHLHEPEDNKSS